MGNNRGDVVEEFLDELAVIKTELKRAQECILKAVTAFETNPATGDRTAYTVLKSYAEDILENGMEESRFNIILTQNYERISTGHVHTGQQILNLLELVSPSSELQAIILLDIFITGLPADNPDDRYGR